MSGYHNWSMSNNAVAAYENGERPISKWTKKAILEAIEEYIYDNDLEDKADIEVFENMTRDYLRSWFLESTGWHHTSKFYNVTYFYALDECYLIDFIEEGNAKLQTIDCNK